jgi:hypothetical protein
MTVRGGGGPAKTMAFMPLYKWVRRLGAFAACAQDRRTTHRAVGVGIDVARYRPSPRAGDHPAEVSFARTARGHHRRIRNSSAATDSLRGCGLIAWAARLTMPLSSLVPAHERPARSVLE